MELQHSTVLFGICLLAFFLLDLGGKLSLEQTALVSPQESAPVNHTTLTTQDLEALGQESPYAEDIDDDVHEEETADLDGTDDVERGSEGERKYEGEYEDLGFNESEESMEDYTIVRNPGQLKGYNYPVHSVCKPRICNHTDNAIWYQFHNKAGLSDRESAIITLGNLAASLCAKLYYAR